MIDLEAEAIGDRISERYALEAKLLAGQSAKDVADLAGDPDGIYAYKEARMFDFIAPLVTCFGDGEWITVGDNGGDARALKRAGVGRVTASSISAVYLRRLAGAGQLDQIGVRDLNAEQMDLPDRAVDVLVCKEAYHHFPRAPLAFYEFLRVSRQGFVLIEPVALPRKPLDFVRSLAKMVLRRRGPAYEEFEPVGNFIYRVSLDEIRRMLTALQVPWFAVRFFNNFIMRSLLRASRRDRLAMLALGFGIAVQDVLVWCRLMSPGMAVIFVPTGATGRDCGDRLAQAGFRIVLTAKNPYRPEDVFRDFYGG
ncbi:MAG TPA: methyltransferase domain-containing protein [Stellaceae bacterium]|jgi:SAM-dependent methyltransferase|nr:methyltransferase domain-containing protein [Stellaceae bacterium]